MNKKPPLVSIVTVNYNQGKVTHELLLSIENLSYKEIEVIIVDNGSKKDCFFLRHSYNIKDVRVIRSEKNLGFAGGNNLAINEAKGDYLFFVNNDTEITPDSIQPLLQRFKLDPRIGIISPKIKYFHNSEIIQYAGYTKISPLTARNSCIGHMEEDNGQHDVATETHYAHGAAMMVKKEVITVVGRMPELFFLYYEELDWCEQIKRKNFKIYFEPSAVVYHKESISVGKNSPLKTYYLTRNRILFMRRNSSSVNFLIFFLYFSFLALPFKLIKFLLNSEWKHFNSLLKGYLWNVKYYLNHQNKKVDNL